MDCLFCKFVSGKIATDIVFEDGLVIAFNDINPQAPVHQLIIPREHMATINDIDNASLIGHMVLVAKQLAQDAGFASNGYRLVMNCNKHGGQEVHHIHLHLLGGRQMTWPPG